ncbi:DDE Tnp4 domain-containing protein [Trichonephila clavipes]|uniref:DDE Tnp4 domain-containing protein n=1 Tax=Trichonephila clavipes TaxID=2585209 RepID=A0A8X6RK19_TRICX|nr:DDE Tnp4 domain-containing protein [Trichonephila clavipes]
MPVFLNKQAQLSTESANATRLVTSIRWVVEAVNGQLKNWRALKNIIPNDQIPYIGDYIKIVCAILTAFHPARISNIEDDNVIAQRMLNVVKEPNYLEQTVEENGRARKRAMWTLLRDSDLPDFFSRLTWKELQYLTLGIYQLKQSRSYTQERLNQIGAVLSLRK